MTALQPLWQIDQELTALLECVETCDEELQPELQAKIAEYVSSSAVKVDQCAHVIAALEYAQKNRKDEIARMQDEIRSAAKAQEKLEAYLCRIIVARGGKKLEGRTNTLSVRTSDWVDVTNATALPSAYATASVVMPAEDWISMGGAFERLGILAKYTPDKVAIKKALKAGEEVPGADLVYRSNLQRR